MIMTKITTTIYIDSDNKDKVKQILQEQGSCISQEVNDLLKRIINDYEKDRTVDRIDLAKYCY